MTFENVVFGTTVTAKKVSVTSAGEIVAVCYPVRGDEVFLAVIEAQRPDVFRG